MEKPISLAELMRTNPWVRIYVSALRGHGTKLSADDCMRLRFDDSLSTHALNVLHDAGFAQTDEGGFVRSVADEEKHLHPDHESYRR